MPDSPGKPFPPDPGRALAGCDRGAPPRVATLAVLLLAVAVGCLLMAIGAGALVHRDGIDYAQIARELADGRGFSSRQAVYALHLRFLLEHDLLSSDWPNLHRFPLLSLVEAIAFRLFGASDGVVFGVGVAAWAAMVALAFHWAWRAVGRVPAVGVAALLASNGPSFYAIQAGVPEPLAALLTSAALYLAWQHRHNADRWRAAAAGGLLGLAVLARTNIVTLLPFLLLDLARGAGARWVRRAFVGLAAFMLVCSPWWTRNVVVAGSPTYSLHSYFLVPAFAEPTAEKRNYSLPWVRDFVSPVDYALDHSGAVADKWLRNTAQLISRLPTFGGTLGVPLLALLALWRRGGGSLRSTAVIVVSGFLANAVLCGFTDFNLPQYYVHLLPGLALLATAVVWNALAFARARRVRVALFAAVIVLISDPSALRDAFERAKRDQRPRASAEQMAFVAANTAPDAVIFSDLSQEIAWRTGRRAIRHHFETWPRGRRVLSIMSFEREFGPIDAIYLSPALMHGELGSTLNHLRREDPGFERTFSCRKFPDGALFCSRRGHGPQG